MNILFLSTRSPYPLISGHSLRTYHILKGAAQKHRVTFMTYTQLPEHEFKKENLDHLRSFCHKVYPFSIPVDNSRVTLAWALCRNLVSPLPFVAHKYGTGAMRKKIRETINKESIDLVHVDLLPLSVYTREFKDLPKILVNHNVESLRLYRWFQAEKNYLKKLYLGLQWLKLRNFERKAMEQFDCCIVVSETDKQLLEKMGVKNTIYVIPNGTDTEFFRPFGGIQRKNRLLWIGHMDVHTNKDAVLYFWKDIYPIIRKNNADLEMVFVGTSPPTEIAEVAQRDKQVMVTGFVDDIRPHLEEAAVVVVPIRIGSGTRLKILDAMAMGKAIISTSVGCEGINVTHNRNILIADGPRDFAQTCLALLKNEAGRKELEKNAVILARSYDWRSIIEKQEAVYHNVLHEKPVNLNVRSISC